MPQCRPLIDAYALQALDPYTSTYERHALPLADPFPVMNWLLSEFDYSGVNPGLEYLHSQRTSKEEQEQQIDQTTPKFVQAGAR